MTKVDKEIEKQRDSISETPIKKSSPPGSELALSAAFWLWGIMISYFPTYAGISPGWAWPFKGLSYVCYALGVVGAVLGLSHLTNSRFLLFLGLATAFGVTAYLLHLWAVNTEAFVISLSLRILVLLLAGLGLVYLLLSIPHLFVREQRGLVEQTEL